MSHGKDSYFQLADKADSLTTFTTQVTDINWDPSKKNPDATAMGAIARENIDGVKDASFSVEAFVDSASTALFRAAYWARGRSKSFVIGPEGSGTGKPKISGSAIQTGMSVKPNVDGTIKMSLTYAINGAWTEATF